MVTAFMFPGAGSYFSAPFARYSPGRRIATEVAERIDAVSVAYGYSSVLSESELESWDPLSELRTYHLQLCCWRILEEELGLRADIVVGHSLGEITSLVVAGGFTAEEGTRLLCERARSLESYAQPTAATAAFMVSPDEAEEFARQEKDVVVAATNSPTQVILSGPAEQVRRLLRMADSRGISATRLRIGPYPQHHPCLDSVLQHYLKSLHGIDPGVLRTAVYSTILGRRLAPDDDLLAVVGAQLVHPLDFPQAVIGLRKAGVDRFVECGLRDTLSRFVVEVAGGDTCVLTPFRTRPTDVNIKKYRKE
ncbi:Phthiocerol synthesis polyketide synthase type I PpsD [Micromonospora sp. MH33]|uniref:ACP S-malonyltransferase n=1 Tax=Micromonospora sp. MH33 TaxID=1945509 RepID=UPI000D297DA7|nr:acyltransferase domain-containing protein [Micromonospora sp. MH33]PSK67663.1 Phthiocerol synthesis polyketide synthase type I PpsD [Micromonospora sp. MH33]